MRVLVAVLVLMFASPAVAGLDDGGVMHSALPATTASPDSQYNAGITLLRVVQNYSGAADWFRKAAEQGHAEAQAALGTLYAAGLGVPVETTTAYGWLSLALPQLSGELRERALDLRGVLAESLSSGQIADMQRWVQDWRPAQR
jgi:TPR repeat protein